MYDVIGSFFFFQAEDGIRDIGVTGVQTCALPISLDLEERDWDLVVDTNLKGVWLAAQGAARRMVRHGIGGSIVNIASILGLRVAGGVAPYAVSKAGVVQLTKSLALEDRKSTRLNSSHANISYAVFCLKKKKKID